MRSTGYLIHGGIMVNYQCTAACRHCLYACSPHRTGGYLSLEQAQSICSLLKEGCCGSVHIGGGEPFLNFDGLLDLVWELRKAGIELEYIETNGYWAVPEETTPAINKLERLLDAGVSALCISVDPYHAEYIPVERPLLLSQLCRERGMGYFLWKQQYAASLSVLDSTVPHTRQELEQAFPGYLWETARSYGLRFGGRAVNIQREYAPLFPAEELLNGKPCRSLLSTDHFHVDLHGRFIPPGCTGIAIPLKQAMGGVPLGAYPVFDALLSSGVAGLYGYAQKLGFRPDPQGYASSCALCFFIRRWLAEQTDSPELDNEHYAAALSHCDGAAAPFAQPGPM